MATRPPRDVDLLGQADRAERAGDMITAAAALRAYVAEHPADARVRLRFARALVAAGERAAARAALAAFEAVPPPVALAADVHRALATLDELEGAVDAAVDRWERVLAHDVDDPEARTRLRALRPQAPAAAGGAAETLVSPEGLETLRFRLRRELGRGATAVVYLATDQTLGVDVALKVLHPQLASAAHADARRRFFAEGRIVAALRHPGVVAIYDVDERARVLAMEHVSGGTLRARLASTPMSTKELAATAASLLDTLAYVHARGIAHGDLKPSNLLVRAPGDVVLADFGAAELRDGAPTGDGPAGTPQYLSPERLRGARPTPASDLYAAGALLWEAAAGRPLRTHADLLRGALTSPALPPEARGALGPRLADLVASLVAEAPAARPPSAAAALSRC
ncbi:MAG TPA: serine/threonine-protein kinase [Polyangia bacterium]|jgi:tRNA A-37 threonylcarbamoyl transferase component Bud32|nr:serine/threonine-protein kinase [Polyangia bacterium]